MSVSLELSSRPLSLRLLRIVLFALVLRLVVMGFLYDSERLNPERYHFAFAGEVGRIAASLVQGKGYGNPMFEDTGPSAELVPIYPCLLALIFRIFGMFTKASAIGILSLNCLFSALTCLPVFFMSRRSFGETAAWRAAWVWAFFPYSIYFAADLIWPTTLTTLLLAVAFLAVLEMQDSTRPGAWVKFGVWSGAAAMSDAIAMSVLPPIGLWMCYRAWRNGRRWFRPALGAAFAFMAVASPWFIRNYHVLHGVVPFRDNFGLELFIGNNPDTSHFRTAYLHPVHSEEEWQQWIQMGELRYMRRKQQEAMAFISEHKRLFLWTSLRRAIYMWTNYWSFNPEYLKDEPFDIPAIFLNTTLSALALWGLWIGWKTLGATVVPYAIALFCFPVVYYVTHTDDYFRRPADPFFVVLAVYAATVWLQRRKQKLQKEMAQD